MQLLCESLSSEITVSAHEITMVLFDVLCIFRYHIFIFNSVLVPHNFFLGEASLDSRFD